MGRDRDSLNQAQKSKKDEFYTLYEDIQKEINAYLDYNPDTFKGKTILLPCDDPDWSNFTKFFAQNFEMLGLKKLISTSFAPDSKNDLYGHNYTEESIIDYKQSSDYEKEQDKRNGKIFILDRDIDGSGNIDINDLQWKYLEGDGDFRSDEITKLRDEADFVITNPPFSLFREFLDWCLKGKKQFMMIGSINCLTYKEVFPRIKANEIWLGNGMGRWISGFIVPPNYELYGTEAREESGKRIVSTNNCLWLTNIDHGKRHRPNENMTMKDNIKFSKHDKIRGKEYKKYDNYDAIDVPYSDAIPSDFKGVMGVPITFLDKYNPELYEIIGLGNGTDFFEPTKKYDEAIMHKNGKESGGGAINRVLVYPLSEEEKNEAKVYYTASNSDKYLFAPYARLLIRRKNNG